MEHGITIIIPFYNEKDAIAKTISEISSTMEDTEWAYEIIAVDDGSTDGGGTAVTTSLAKLITHDENRGYGASIKSALAASRYDWAGIIDADGTYDPREIPRLLDRAKNCAMVVGARTMPGASIPKRRRPAKWFLTKLASVLSNIKIPDLNSGMRIFRKQLALDYMHLFPDGFSFTTTITLAFLSENHPVVYLPVAYHPRTGKSKIHPIKDTLRFFNLIIRTVALFYPLRFFIPLSLLLLLCGCGLAIFQAVAYKNITTVSALLIITALQTATMGFMCDLIALGMKRHKK